MGDTKLELVKRFCACGCGKSWKTLPQSKSYYYSLVHTPEDELRKTIRKRYLFLMDIYDF